MHPSSQFRVLDIILILVPRKLKDIKIYHEAEVVSFPQPYVFLFLHIRRNSRFPSFFQLLVEAGNDMFGSL